MSSPNPKCDTWQDVLINNNIEPSVSGNFIGFISWNRGEDFAKLGREITEVLSGYEGKVYAKDAVSRKYNDKGLLFFSNDISEDKAGEIFDIIMSYKQNHVYDSL